MLITLIINTQAQTVLMEEDSYYEKPSFGLNYRHYVHSYIGIDFFSVNPIEEQLSIKYGLSRTFSFGYRYKLKITNWLATGADIKYSSTRYSLANTFTPFENISEIKHNSDAIKFGTLGPEIYLRLNFGRRGNSIGKFVDIGAYINGLIFSQHIYKENINSNPYQASTTKVTNSQLDYLENYYYGAKLRFGYKQFVLSFDYRYSDLFKSEIKNELGIKELPRFSIGLQIGLHS